MYRLTIESTQQTFDTLAEMVTWLKSNYTDPLAHEFDVEKQVDGSWVPNPDKFSML